ncbi:hypothetical protein AB7102_00860 [Providencia manganoxydans]|uniref:hypothetical protein n=1 Tax=Providencia manganoxydans TaxID=2923283 RepID=UPI0034E5A79E
MDLRIDIPEKNLDGFTKGAQDSLKKAVLNYSNELIEESNRIEADRNASNKNAEVTGAIVNDAVFYIKRGLTKRKKSRLMIACKITSAIASLFAGALYDPAKFTEGHDIIYFIAAVVIAIISISISVIKE